MRRPRRFGAIPKPTRPREGRYPEPFNPLCPPSCGRPSKDAWATPVPVDQSDGATEIQSRRPLSVPQVPTDPCRFALDQFTELELPWLSLAYTDTVVRVRTGG